MAHQSNLWHSLKKIDDEKSWHKNEDEQQQKNEDVMVPSSDLLNGRQTSPFSAASMLTITIKCLRRPRVKNFNLYSIGTTKPLDDDEVATQQRL